MKSLSYDVDLVSRVIHGVCAINEDKIGYDTRSGVCLESYCVRVYNVHCLSGSNCAGMYSVHGRVIVDNMYEFQYQRCQENVLLKFFTLFLAAVYEKSIDMSKSKY